MHELHLIEPIIKSISEHAQKEGAKIVTKVHLKLGQFTGAKEDSFRETFGVLSKGTILENARLELTSFPCSHVQVLSFDFE